MKKVLFIDRDGTILQEPADEQIDRIDKMRFLPYCIQSLARIAREGDYECVLVSNQDGLGTDSFPEADFWPVQNLMLDILKGEGLVFSEIHIDRSTAAAPSPGRKPGTAMLQKYIHGPYDLSASFVIGDRLSDIELAENLGCQAIYINAEKNENAAFCSENWLEIADFLLKKPRLAQISRKTKETDIQLSLNLDGSGKNAIHTGLGFFDHMLEQIARHGLIDLEVRCKGDLHVDEHHTIEDVALCLGQAFREALGAKKGIERYGFSLPMDESDAQVLLDFGGRPYFKWQADFTREKVGDMPTELFSHFFKSFSDESRSNLHIAATGENEHHKIEAIFKAFAKAIKMAKTKNADFQIPSTKGMI